MGFGLTAGGMGGAIGGGAGGLGSLFSAGAAGPIGLGIMGAGSILGGIGSALGLGPSGTTPQMYTQMRTTLPGSMRATMSPEQLKLWRSIFPMVQKNMMAYGSGADPFTRFGKSGGSLGNLKSQALALSNFYRAKAGV